MRFISGRAAPHAMIQWDTNIFESSFVNEKNSIQTRCVQRHKQQLTDALYKRQFMYINRCFLIIFLFSVW